jgi:two-component system chemotaxis sensor kinase CheA
MQLDDQILDEFLIEAEEIFDQLDIDFVKLESAPEDKALIGNIFRAMHTLKGSSGFFGFVRIEKVAHASESLLSKLRDGTYVIDVAITNALLSALDCLRGIVTQIQSARAEPAGDDTALVDQLLAMAEGGSGAAPAVATVVATPAAVSAEVLVEAVAEVLTAPVVPEESVAQTMPEQPIENPVVAPQVPAAFQPTGGEVRAPEGTRDAASEKSHDFAAPIKVNVDLLDNLMNLVSEMVLARNRLLSFAKSSYDLSFLNTVRSIDVITMGLQERMMMTRMQPIKNIWSKFPRLVRDVAQETGKLVELVQIGAETELDRTLLESIRDPMTHIIRNSIDHGIETPEVRQQKGKNPTGTITLNAFHEKGMIVVELGDDGAGVNIPLVAQKATQMGLVAQEKVSRLSDREIVDFIYLPGFSTKTQVTNLSGRGVGMDVVRTNVQEIGGTVEIVTSEAGTKIRLRIPLTLAIMPAVFVRCGEQQFAIPQSNVVEMVRHHAEEGKPGVEDFYGVPVLRLRDRLIPLLFLNKELGIAPLNENAEAPLNIVLVQAAGILFGLVAEEIMFMQEIVVKSVGPLMKGTPIYSGTTILGDGRVSLIFDISGIAIRSGLISKLMENEFQSTISEEAAQLSDETDAFLLFDLHGMERVAIPLAYVTRLESVNVADIYQRGTHDVVMYDDHIMQLIWLDDLVEGASRDGLYVDRPISVIVYYVDDKPVGFVVRKIFDIFHVNAEVTISGPVQKGITGSAIVNDKVVSFLNVPEILEMYSLAKATAPKVLDNTMNESYGVVVARS